MCLTEAILPMAGKAPLSSNGTAVYLYISQLPLILGELQVYPLGLSSYCNELSLETSSRQKSNVLPLYLNNL